jgi:outer membrane protein OmpA-like peptidoglycan-associated protein
MSALMVLFLVVMAVTLVSVTQSIDAATRENIERSAAIKKLMQMIAEDPKSSGVGVDQQNFRIDLGKEVRFDSGSFTINAAAGEFLRSYIPVLLRAKDSNEGKVWLRSVVVEGFTDEDGTYLYNLQLSLDRSRSVVCSLFEANGAPEALTSEQLRKVQELFLVGGYSFNSIKKDKAESRRVEFKIDFWGPGERPPPSERSDVLKGKEFGQC